MRKIISEYRTKYPEEKINNSLYEISYPMDDIAYYDAVSVHRGISSKNPLIYSLLGLDELYESLYANDTSLFFDAYYDEFKNETNEAVMAHARYFNNLSHIYRWINEDGVARYAVGPQRNKQEVTTLERVARAQESFSCSEEEMKRVIEAYYRTTSYTDVMSENLIIDVPILNDQNYPIWYEINKNLDDYTNDNRALYEKFGILTGYRIKFGA